MLGFNKDFVGPPDPNRKFDIQSLLGNPMLHAGIGLLGSKGNNGAQAALQGALQGMQYKQQFQDRDKAMQTADAQKAAMGRLGETMPSFQPFVGTGLEKEGLSLLGKQAATAAGQTGVQGSAIKLGNGKIGYLTKTGQIVETETPFHQPAQTFKVGGVQYTMGADGVPTPAVDPNTVASNAANIAASEAAAKQAVALSGNAFEQLRPTMENIATIDQAIYQLDQGANTGPIMSMLPSMTSASVSLDNLQAQMGLNVISNTTFGALSEGELKLALSTAMPQDLKPAELRKWLVDKKNAQTKMANYLQEAATYLGTPNNTIAGFLDMKRAQGGNGKVNWADM